MKTDITANTSSTDALIKASTHVFDGHSMLSFDDEHGCARITLHRVPIEVAEATAAAFNEAMEAHENPAPGVPDFLQPVDAEPTHDPDFEYPRPEPIDLGESA